MDAKSLMIIDRCHYQLVKIIKESNYDDLSMVQSQLKSAIDNQIDTIDNINYSQTAQEITYILTAFTDNLFLIYGPPQYHQPWQKQTMEKTYFQTATSGYIFSKKIQKIMENNGEMSPFLIYGYWLFFESLGNQHQLYTDSMVKFFKKSLTFTTNQPVIDLKVVHHNQQTIKTNTFNLIFLSIILVFMVIGNKYLYMLWINGLIL